jgi:chromatin segregation and condensation protein Rec8/ScpA/Scc1 (kleisin family)
MKFLDVKTEEDLNMIAEKSPAIKKAAARLMELSADEQARMLYEAREKERRDYFSRERGAVTIALKSREIEMAKSLLNMDMSADKISLVTGLTHTEIESLRHAD